jgi:hypothetical protein
MGFATHLGGWLLGTVKEGDKVNTGGTVSLQYARITAPALTATGITLPAGAIIEDITIDVTTLFDGTTPTLSVGVTGTPALYASGSVLTAAARVRPAFTAAQMTALSNVGTTDVPVLLTNTAANSTVGSALVKITYVVRDSAGNLRPTSA